MAMSDKTICVVAALIRDDGGRVLLVRKRGTAAFMQPGGKRGAGESDVAALAREIDEDSDAGSPRTARGRSGCSTRRRRTSRVSWCAPPSTRSMSRA
jgi:hypothetical protein